jgi:hypothetical protein
LEGDEEVDLSEDGRKYREWRGDEGGSKDKENESSKNDNDSGPGNKMDKN